MTLAMLRENVESVSSIADVAPAGLGEREAGAATTSLVHRVDAGEFVAALD